MNVSIHALMKFPKIAVPTNDRVEVFAHTGRAEGFGIYEVRGESIRLIDYKVNPNEHHHHGHIHTEACSHTPGVVHTTNNHNAIIGILRHCDALVACRIGPHLKDDLNKAGIRFFISSENFVEDAIWDYFRQSKLM